LIKGDENVKEEENNYIKKEKNEIENETFESENNTIDNIDTNESIFVFNYSPFTYFHKGGNPKTPFGPHKNYQMFLSKDKLLNNHETKSQQIQIESLTSTITQLNIQLNQIQISQLKKDTNNKNKSKEIMSKDKVNNTE